MRKLLFSLLVLLSLSFAGPTDAEQPEWVLPAFIAAFAAIGVLIVLYMLSYLFDSAEMRSLARHEMWQVFITVFFIIFFVAIEAYSTSALSSAFAETFGGEVNHVEFAKSISQGLSDVQWSNLLSLSKKLTVPLASMASSSGTCNMMGSSFSYSGCAGIQAPVSSLIFATGVLVSAMMVNNSQTFLLDLSASFFFPVLLPLGLFFRCFHFTRGAGGILIAISVAFYFVYPISVMLTWGMAQQAAGNVEEELGLDLTSPAIPSDIKYPEEMFGQSFDSFEIESDCNPLNMDAEAARDQANRLVGESGDSLVDPLLFLFFVSGLFTTMLNLLITLSAARGMASIFGAEVDISGLARIS